MIYDATLKKLFQRPPNRLFSEALRRQIRVKRMLPTELITVENLHPDLLFETEDGELIHAELQGYAMADFACRNLIYFGLVLRDYHRAPAQVVFWIGPRSVGVSGGLDFEPNLRYRYQVVDVRELDAKFLLESPDVNELIFAILCKLNDERAVVTRILERIATLPAVEQREAIAQLLILSGLRGLKSLVKEGIAHMPVSIDIHENEFLEEVFQEGQSEGLTKGIAQGLAQGRTEATRELLIEQLERKFGALPTETLELLHRSEFDALRCYFGRVAQSARLRQVFENE